MKARVTFNVQLPYAVRRNGVAHVAWCPALDVYSQGPSHKKAVTNLADALRLFLMSCYERGTLDQVLRESGFRPANATRRTSKKKAVSKKFDTLLVPLPFLVDARSDSTSSWRTSEPRGFRARTISGF